MNERERGTGERGDRNATRDQNPPESKWSSTIGHLNEHENKNNPTRTVPFSMAVKNTKNSVRKSFIIIMVANVVVENKYESVRKSKLYSGV
jgi:hypothetical protein